MQKIGEIVVCLVLCWSMFASGHGHQETVSKIIRHEELLPPIWPKTWTASFMEVTMLNVTVQSTSPGIFYYDATQSAMRTDFENGLTNAFCGSVMPKATNCSAVITQNGFFLNYPDNDYCCQCCNGSICQILRPDWVVNDNGTFIGQVTINGEECDEYLIIGFSKNYWAQRTSDGVPCELSNGGEEIYVYNQDTFSTAGIPSQVFELPSSCTQKCPEDSFCSIFGI